MNLFVFHNDNAKWNKYGVTCLYFQKPNSEAASQYTARQVSGDGGKKWQQIGKVAKKMLVELNFA